MCSTQHSTSNSLHRFQTYIMANLFLWAPCLRNQTFSLGKQELCSHCPTKTIKQKQKKQKPLGMIMKMSSMIIGHPMSTDIYNPTSPSFWCSWSTINMDLHLLNHQIPHTTMGLSVFRLHVAYHNSKINHMSSKDPPGCIHLTKSTPKLAPMLFP